MDRQNEVACLFPHDSIGTDTAGGDVDWLYFSPTMFQFPITRKSRWQKKIEKKKKNEKRKGIL